MDVHQLGITKQISRRLWVKAFLGVHTTELLSEVALIPGFSSPHLGAVEHMSLKLHQQRKFHITVNRWTTKLQLNCLGEN